MINRESVISSGLYFATVTSIMQDGEASAFLSIQSEQTVSVFAKSFVVQLRPSRLHSPYSRTLRCYNHVTYRHRLFPSGCFYLPPPLMESNRAGTIHPISQFDAITILQYVLCNF